MNNNDKRRKRRRPAIGWWCCCGIGFVVLLGLLAVVITVPLVTRPTAPRTVTTTTTATTSTTTGTTSTTSTTTTTTTTTAAPTTAPPFQCNDTMPSLPQILMSPPPEAPMGAALMWSPVNGSMFYASGNRGVILTGQYLWPINPDTLVVGPNVYRTDYPWEDQITGMGYWAGNGSRFIFAERNYANLWSTDLMGGDVQLILTMDVERRGIAIVGDLAYLPATANNNVQEISLSTGMVLRNISATDIGGPVSRVYGMTAHPITGDIWAAWDAAGAPFAIYFGVFNATSGFCTRSCNGPFVASVSSIAFDGEGRMWLSIGGEPPGDIYRYNGGTPCLCP